MISSSDLADLDALASLGTATIVEVVAHDVKIVDRAIGALGPNQACAGVAFTVRCVPGDNLALHHALARLGRGEVLVVDYGQSIDTGPFGEIMALAAQTRGVTGLVIDGAVRDSAQMSAFGFPVWARGLSIPGTIKADPGVLGEWCNVGAVWVAQGDIVVADADAIIVFPPHAIAHNLEKGHERIAKENEMMDRIRAGETTFDILGLSPTKGDSDDN